MKRISVLLAAFGIFLFLHSCTGEGSTVHTPDYVDLEGNDLRFAGKITVVNVWATWCGTCIQEMPQLNALQNKYKNDPDIQFIAFADENEKIVKKALRRWPFAYRQVVDARSFTRGLKSGVVKTYPQNLILDANEKVVFEQTDGSADIFKALDDKIQELKAKSID